jgi:hypothetical protein
LVRYLKTRRSQFGPKYDVNSVRSTKTVARREDLTKRLLDLQDAKGFWVNSNNRWWEKDPLEAVQSASWRQKTVGILAQHGSPIHRKPGFDPVELFLDPAQPLIKAKIAWRLLQKRVGFRILMDVIPLDASLVRGSHGRCPNDRLEWPLIISPRHDLAPKADITSTQVYDILREHLIT